MHMVQEVLAKFGCSQVTMSTHLMNDLMITHDGRKPLIELGITHAKEWKTTIISIAAYGCQMNLDLIQY